VRFWALIHSCPLTDAGYVVSFRLATVSDGFQLEGVEIVKLEQTIGAGHVRARLPGAAYAGFKVLT
jgi:hypothetical protein